MPDREHDIVVYGATGFVGRLVAGYLAAHAPASTKIALAGRTLRRLEEARDALPPAAAGWPLVVADAADGPALAQLAAGTSVVATTVGPYARYGLPLVAACAAAGTHYADLTGELLFVREVMERADRQARETGARLVHSCGYDSIPSDLGVLLCHRAATADGAGDLDDVRLVAALRGGFSGGTIDSFRGQLAAVGGDRSLRRVLADPYALSPDRAAEPTTRQPGDVPRPGRQGEVWTAPFVMAGYNTRIVRRSNALQDWAYGREMRYRESMGFGSGPVAPVLALATTAGLAAGVAGMSFGPTRSLLDRLLPAPGEGPSEATQRKGWFRMDLEATTAGGNRYAAVVSGKGDPGYAATAVMLGESALCLAQDADRLPERAGSLTPATAMGQVLIERLRAAGHTYEVHPA